MACTLTPGITQKRKKPLISIVVPKYLILYSFFGIKYVAMATNTANWIPFERP